MEQMLSGFSRLINRLSLSVIVAAMVIGLTILIATTSNGSLLHTLIGFSFLGVVIFGIWLLISIMRGK